MPTNEKRGPADNGAAPEDQAKVFREYIAGLRRRRAASYRLVPLECGCRDTWTCRCGQPEPSERMTDAATQAGEYLLHHGLPPIYSISQGRALWRAGHRELAVKCVQQVSA
ncbi:hypothetical protein B7435_33430 [Mycolicibacterium peregrinum]|uniref:hypothetical protein n=1 Tax=Mycobacteriaceae TaxID=1762 RepID=UPI000B4B1873|nr:MULTISPECIES: hypothetical protein [Mycobacteriaceae]MBN7452626.1 hypothetical protein [Mycobacteroides abscessus subsp. abscessus]OWL92827.1 hypothetical protein B7435_33430 [Mycolicibacterium peregrinum]